MTIMNTQTAIDRVRLREQREKNGKLEYKHFKNHATVF